MQRNLTEGSVFKNILIFAIPYFISTFLQSFYGLVDLLVAGHFNGAAVISAVSSGSQVMHMITVTIVGFAMGGTVLIGRMVGEKDKKGTSVAIGNTILIFLVIAVLLTIGLLFSLQKILGLLSVPQEAWGQTADYLRVCFMGIPFIVGYNVTSCIFRGLGDTKTPMYFVAVSGILNVILDFILIGPFQMGAKGAAIATVSSQIVSVILAAIALFKPQRGLHFSGNDFLLKKEVVGAILRVGLPLAAQEFLVQLSFLVITAIANDRGVIASASVGIVEKIIGFLFLFQSSMLAAVSTLTAQNIGANKHEQGEKALKYGILLGMAYSLCVILICEIFAEGIIGLFTTGEPEVIVMGSQYLRSYVIDAFFVSIHFCFSGYFTAYGKSVLSFMQNLLAIIFFRIPGAYLASALFPATLFPMGLAAPAGSCFSSLICIIAYLKCHKKWIQKCLLAEDVV
jgi:putative MATE family efflux protein